MKIKDLCVSEKDTLETVGKLHQINALGLAFIIDKKGCLLGTLSDGDFRRSILSGASLDDIVINYMNSSPFSMPDNTSLAELAHLVVKYKVIPLINSEGILVDYFSKEHLSGIPVSQPKLNGNEFKYVSDCLETNWISSQGKYVEQFESLLNEYVGAADTLAVSNGTVALQLALSTLGIGPGDEVIIPTLTFGATANSVLAVGATPHFIDINFNDLNLDIDKVIASITSNTKAIIAVDLYGIPFRMKELKSKLAHRQDIYLIQDCAESLGAYESGLHTGSYADVCTFSFFANKIITTGEGGAVCFIKKGLSNKGRIIRDHGMDPEKRYHHLYPGFNYRMTNIQAAIGVAQLEKITDILNLRRNIFTQYNNKLNRAEVLHQELPNMAISSPWLYTIRLPGYNIDKVQEVLKDNGIDTRKIFAPLHNMDPFKMFKNDGGLNANLSYKFGISLPTFSDMTEKQVIFVCGVLNKVLDKKLMMET